MKQFAVLTGLMVLMTLPACVFIDDDHGINCVNGHGDRVTEVLNLSNFSGISLTIPAKVFLRQGDEQRVEVEAQENIIDLIERDVRNEVWEIEFEDCAFSYSLVEITITLPDLDLVEITSSGDVYTLEQFEVGSLELRLSGSGNMRVDAATLDVDARISGSGDIRMDGTCQDLYVLISGSGDFEGFGLEAENAECIISGSGNIETLVTENLDVTISGSGNVYYRGTPLIDVSISGTGKVVNAN